MQESGGMNSFSRKLRRDWWKTRLCTSCVSPLGRIIARGGICPQCGLRVCKSCREAQPGNNNAWICVLCSNGGITPDYFAKTKSLGRDSRSIRRSWTISTPERAQTNSPILKSYTLLHPEETSSLGSSNAANVSGTTKTAKNVQCTTFSSKPASRQFHSLPRMNSDSSDRAKKSKRSFNQPKPDKENIKRHRSFQSTLHPYQPQNPPSPSASINFIEDPFWDYYDYDIEGTPSTSPRSPRYIRTPKVRSLAGGHSTVSIFHRRDSIRNKLESDMDRLLKLNLRTYSNRSSCERSLGETYDYDYSKNNSSYAYSNFNSLSDTELNGNITFDQEDASSTSTITPRKHGTSSGISNFYRFATVTPANMSPMSDTRRDSEGSTVIATSTPVKPERKCNKNKRSASLNSYDGKKLFSPLKTYVVVMKENVVPKTNNITDTNANATTAINPTAAITDNNSTRVKSQSATPTSSLLGSTTNLQPREKERQNAKEFGSSKINKSKFHSLPRERVIRIEREDGKFAQARERNRQPESREDNKGLNKNVSKVEITRSISSVSAKELETIANNGRQHEVLIPIEKSGRMITRSQSYREFPSGSRNARVFEFGNGTKEAPFLSVVNLRASPGPESPNLLNHDTSTLPLTRGKVRSLSTNSAKQKPFDQDVPPHIDNSSKPRRRPDLSSNETNDFLQSKRTEFEDLARRQAGNVDDYLRQCSTFPRSLNKQRLTNGHAKMENGGTMEDASSRKIVCDSIPNFKRRHTSSTLITHDDNSVLDEKCLHNQVTSRGESNKMDFFTWNATATLPHPYIRKHKEQKSSFVKPKLCHDEDFVKEKKRISSIEQEIERDIYFQKTRSLDRIRSQKQKPSIFDTRLDDDTRGTLVTTTAEASSQPPPPIASPRLKRKSKPVVEGNDDDGNHHDPKINVVGNQDACGISGTKNRLKSSLLPNEPRAFCKDPKSLLSSVSTSMPSIGPKFIFESLQPTFTNANAKVLGKLAESQKPYHQEEDSSIMKMSPNYKSELQQKVVLINVESVGVEPPVATPRTRRRASSGGNANQVTQVQNSNNKSTAGMEGEVSHNRGLNLPNFHDFNTTNSIQSNSQDEGRILNNNYDDDGGMNINFNLTNGIPNKSASSSNINNFQKAVRFEPHVIEMENEREHNKANNKTLSTSSSSSSAVNSNPTSGMRMNNGSINDDGPISSQSLNGAYSPPKQHNRINNNNNNSAVNNGGVNNNFQPPPPQAYHLNYTTPEKSVYSFHHHDEKLSSQKAPSSINKRQQHGFVARAIAKVKSKAKINKGKNGSGKYASSGTSKGKLRSIETRDSITYIISPPPTTQSHSNQYADQSQISVIEEITPKPNSGPPPPSDETEGENDNGLNYAKYDEDYHHHHGHANANDIHHNHHHNKPIISASNELLAKPGILKNSTGDNKALIPNPTLGLTTPQKPKRSSLKKNLAAQAISHPSSLKRNLLPQPPPLPPVRMEAQATGPEEEEDDQPLPSPLSIDQQSPSSTSTSSSSYMSNVRESYSFNHHPSGGEECESVEEGGEESCIFKSFEDDEDAGEDFIFYCEQKDEDSLKDRVHDKNTRGNINMTVMNNNGKTSHANNLNNIKLKSSSASSSSSKVQQQSLLTSNQIASVNDISDDDSDHKGNKNYGEIAPEGGGSSKKKKSQAGLPPPQGKKTSSIPMPISVVSKKRGSTGSGSSSLISGKTDQSSGIDNDNCLKKYKQLTTMLGNNEEEEKGEDAVVAAAVPLRTMQLRHHHHATAPIKKSSGELAYVTEPDKEERAKGVEFEFEFESALHQHQPHFLFNSNIERLSDPQTGSGSGSASLKNRANTHSHVDDESYDGDGGKAKSMSIPPAAKSKLIHENCTTLNSQPWLRFSNNNNNQDSNYFKDSSGGVSSGALGPSIHSSTSIYDSGSPRSLSLFEKYGAQLKQLEETASSLQDFDHLSYLKQERGRDEPELLNGQSPPKFHFPTSSNRSGSGNLLLPSSFLPRSPIGNPPPYLSQSEFFPGGGSGPPAPHPPPFVDSDEDPFVDEGRGNMSSPSTTPKFKSSVLVNPDEESARRALSPNHIPVISRSGSFKQQQQQQQQRNVTTVEISGDVGIVNSNAAAAFLNSKRAQLKKVNKDSLWKSSNDDDSSDNDNNNSYSPSQLRQMSGGESSGGEGSSQNDYGNNYQEGGVIIPSSPSGADPSNNPVLSKTEEPGQDRRGSGGPDSSPAATTPKRKSVSSNSDDGSDWNSESTKNTVIFRGDTAGHSTTPSSSSSTVSEDTLVDEDRGVFSYAGREPEIHISSIDLLDVNEFSEGGSRVPHTKEQLVSANKDNPPPPAMTDVIHSTHNDNEGDKDNKSIKKPNGKSSVTSSDAANNSTSVCDPLAKEGVEMVQPNNLSEATNKSSFHGRRRESPEGQEQEVPPVHPDDKINPTPDSNVVVKPEPKKFLGAGEVIIMEKKSKGSSGGEVLSKSRISQNALSQITASSRSSPDGADADRSEAGSTTTTEPEIESPTPTIDQFDVTSDDDSWVEEITFEDDETEIQMCRKAQPPPLDLTLHTIVEESCEESEAESGHFNSHNRLKSQKRKATVQQSDNELEKYFNFGINLTPGGSNSHDGRGSFSNDGCLSDYSDTFSESSFSMQDDQDDGPVSSPGNKQQRYPVDPAELASSRLEKYFYNLGLPQSMIHPISSINQTADSDSVGSESESDNSVLDNRKKVLKHHRRSADFEEDLADQVSDEEREFGFGQDGFDTIKKTSRKAKKLGSDNSLEETGASSNSCVVSSKNFNCSAPNASRVVDPLKTTTSPSKLVLDTPTLGREAPTSPTTSKNDSSKERPVIKVSRSNSFQWSSDEEVNIMMSKLRQLIRNLVKSKINADVSRADQKKDATTPPNSPAAVDKDKQLAYLEGELVRLMKSDNLMNIVEYLSSEESDVDDVYKFIKGVKDSGSINSNPEDISDFDLEDPNLLETQVTPKSSPALLAKVMHHIGNRLAVWMKDENIPDDDAIDETVLKAAQSISSDLNDDRFSWKGSFESALAAKRQSVGSTDSLESDCNQDRSILRSSSLHHLANSAHHLGQVVENKEEEESVSSLPRMTNLCNSLPRLNQPSNLSISRAQSLVMSERPDSESAISSSSNAPIKSARYRPPGFQQVKSKRMDDEGKNSPTLSQSTPVLSQESGQLRMRSESVCSINQDGSKPQIPVRGHVEFGLQYNYKSASLEVHVKQCRDLASVDSKRNRSDPYVKAYLLPDRSKGGKRKTKTKKNTLNPVFEETLKFPLNLSDLQNRSLWLSVWHSDTFGKNEFLGEVFVDLKDRVFDDPSPQAWDLQEMSGLAADMPKGDVVLALKWQPKTDDSGNLSVLVKEAKNLSPVRNGGSPSTFIKCLLLSDKSRKHKTSICRKSYNPVWNQTLSFEDAGDDGLEITLWNHDLLSNNNLLGTIRVDYDHPLWNSMLSRHSFWVEGILRLR